MSARPGDRVVPAILISLLAVLLFDLMGLVIKHLSTSYGAAELSAWRNLFGLIPGLIALYSTRSWHDAGRPWRMRQWHIPLIRGIAVTFAQFCFYLALGRLAFATAATISYSNALFIVALSVPILGERVGSLPLVRRPDRICRGRPGDGAGPRRVQPRRAPAAGGGDPLCRGGRDLAAARRRCAERAGEPAFVERRRHRRAWAGAGDRGVHARGVLGRHGLDRRDGGVRRHGGPVHRRGLPDDRTLEPRPILLFRHPHRAPARLGLLRRGADRRPVPRRAPDRRGRVDDRLAGTAPRKGLREGPD
jgi:uncharacterized membrane protein